MKKVRITLELDEEFVRLLKANCAMSGLGDMREVSKSHDPMMILAMVTNLEARGATEQQIHEETPLEWRGKIVPIHDERKVIVDG